MNSTALQFITTQRQYLLDNKKNLTIDADTHITSPDNLPEAVSQKLASTENYYHGRPITSEELLAEMNLADVDMALIWQNPAATPYGNDQKENFERLMVANEYIHQSARQYPEKFIPAGWTDPKALGVDLAKKVAQICIQEFGFPILKMNPAQNAYNMDSEMVLAVMDEIIACNGMPAFHFGSDTPYTPVSSLKRLAERYPDTPILAVHMAGGGAGYVEAEKNYTETRELGLKYPNLRFALSAKRDTHMESDIITYQLAGEPFCQNLYCASDAPYGRITWNFGGFRCMFKSLMQNDLHPDRRVKENPGFFDEQAASNFLGNNFAQLIIDRYSLMISK
jgi:predicted TIM-barrel fold metal-dependent hydrolase